MSTSHNEKLTIKQLFYELKIINERLEALEDYLIQLRVNPNEETLSESTEDYICYTQWENGGE